MYEGIKILNGGQTVDLGDLQKSGEGEHLLYGISSLKIYVDDGAVYNENIEILENNSDVKISITDAEGNEIFIILRGLGEILLTNNSEIPVFEVFQGLGGEKLASMVTIDDLDAAAAGGETLTAEQTGNPDGVGALGATDSADIANRLPGLGNPGPNDPNGPTFTYDVTFGGDNALVVTEDVGQSEEGILSGVLTATDPHFGILSFIPQSTTTEYGIFTLDADGNWTYDLFEDNPDIQGLTDDESFLDSIVIQLEGLVAQYDFEVTINGLNDQPVINNININDESGEDIYSDEFYGEDRQIKSLGEDDDFYPGEDGPLLESVLLETHDSYGEDGTDDEGNNIYSGLVAISDADYGNIHTLHIDDVEVIDNNNAGVTYPEDISVSFEKNEFGEWEYIINGDFSELAIGEALTLNISYYADDNSRDDLDNPYESDTETDDTTNENSRSDIKVITLTITGTNDQPVLQSVVDYGDDGAPIIETSMKNTVDEPVNTITGTLTALDDDTNDTHFFRLDYLPQGMEFLSREGNDYSNNYQNIDFKRVAEYGGTESASVIVESNDIDASEIDIQEIRFLNNDRADSQVNFALDGDFKALGVGETATVTFKYVAGDGQHIQDGNSYNEPSRAEPEYVTITIEGTNDQPVVLDVMHGDGSGDSELIYTNGEDNSIYDYNETISTIEVPENAEITDLNVNLTLYHSFDGDLIIKLIAPDGTEIPLSSGIGGGGDNYINTTFDNEGASDINSSSAPYSGIFRPEGDLSILDGMDTQGTWTLSIYDRYGGDSGYLDSWTLDFTVNDGQLIYETHDSEYYANGEDDTQDDVNTLFEGTLRVEDDDVNDTHTFHLVQGSVAIDNMATQTVLLGQKGDSELSLINWGDKDNNHTRVMELENGMTVTTSSDSSRLKQYNEEENHVGEGIGDNDGNGIQSGENIIVTFDGGQVNSATFGFDGLGGHFREDSSEQAKATWIAKNNGVEVARGVVDSETLFLEVGTNVAFDEVIFSTDSSVDSNWELRYVEAEVIPLEIVVDENGEYDVEGNFNYLAAGETATVTFDYYAEDNRGITDPLDPNHELSRSEPSTVTLTITGTNDQPIIENIVLGIDDPETRRDETIYETHDRKDKDGVDDTDGEKGADRRQEPLNIISGRLSASDDDLSDTHIFGLSDMELERVPSGRDFDGPSSELVSVNYDLHGNIRPRIEGEVEVLFDSEYVNAEDIDINKITFFSNGGNDSQASFELKGDFSALGTGETATVTFKYYADDQILDEHGESNLSEYKTVSITVSGTNDQPIVENVVLGIDDPETKRDETIYEDTLRDYRGIEDSLFTGELARAMDNDVNDRDHHYKIVGSVLVSKNLAGITADDIDLTLQDIEANGWSTSLNYDMFSDKFNTLGDGETVTVEFQYKASDWNGFGTTGDNNNEASHSETKTVTITITGTNDQPVVDNIDIGDTPSNIVYESSLLDRRGSEEALFKGKLTEARDEDVTNTNPQYMLVGDVLVSKNLAGITENDVEVLLKDVNSNGWSENRNYGVFSDKFDALGVDETVTVTFKYKASDWEGFGTAGDLHNEPSHSEIKTVTLTITGTNDQPEVDSVERTIAEEINGANVIGGQLVAQDDDVTNASEITFALVDFDFIVPSNDEVVYSVGGNTFKLVSDDVNVNNFTDKITSINVNSDGTYSVEGDFTKLSTDEEITLIFQYQADDNEGKLSGDLIHEQSLSNIQTVEITIVGTNDSPRIKDVINSVDFTENDPALILDGLLKVRDPDDSEMTSATVSIALNYESGFDFLGIENQYLANGVTATFTNGVLTLEGVATKSDYENMLEKVTFINTSEDPSSSPRTVEWVISDGENFSAPKETIVNVIPENDAPIARKNYNEVTEAGVGVSAAANLSGNIITQPDNNGKIDSDVDNPEDLVITGIKSENNSSNFDTSLNHMLNGQPALKIAGEYGVLFVDANGNYEYNLKDNWTSTESLAEDDVAKDKFIYRLSDGDKSDTSKLIITINGTNDAPIVEDDTYTNAANDSLTTLEDTPLVIAPLILLANDSDAEGDDLEITNVNLVNPLAGSVEIDINGNVVFTPEPNFSGEATFEYTVSDGNGGTSDGIVTVNVLPDADAPILDVDIADPIVTPGSIEYDDTNGRDIENITPNSFIEVDTLDGSSEILISLKSYKNDGNVNANDNGYIYVNNGTTKFEINDILTSKGISLSNQNYDLVVTNTDLGVSSIDYLKIGNDGKELKTNGIFGTSTTSSTYEYQVIINGALSDNSELLSDVTITGIPSGAELTDTNNASISVGDVVSLNGGSVTLTLTSTTELSPSDLDLFSTEITSSEMDGATVLDSAVSTAIHNMLSFSADDANLDFNTVSDSDLPKVEEIDLTIGDHILSNINVDDVLAMTDNDILKIDGDAGDKISLDSNEWKVASNDTVDGTGKGIDDDSDGYVTYTNISASGGAAAEALQLLINEDIDVKL